MAPTSSTAYTKPTNRSRASISWCTHDRCLRHALDAIIAGQLFSKSFLGYTSYKMDFATREGLTAHARSAEMRKGR